MAEFNTQNLQLATFVVSVYILGFAAGPLIIAPLSEIYGRVPVYHICNFGFTIFAVACALAPNMHALIGFRFLNGIFGSCPATIGGGSITDMIPQERRASVMAAYSIGALFAPIVGPMVGGLLADVLGWRWDFWLLAISGAVVSILQLAVLKETYHPIILERKATRMRQVTGRKQLRSKLDSGLSPREYLIRNLVRPIKMLTFSPIVIITALFIAITYGYMCKFSTFIRHYTPTDLIKMCSSHPSQSSSRNTMTSTPATLEFASLASVWALSSALAFLALSQIESLKPKPPSSHPSPQTRRGVPPETKAQSLKQRLYNPNTVCHPFLSLFFL
jgi:multidrug resistance protein